MPKCRSLAFFVYDISGSRALRLFFVEVVASTTVPVPSGYPYSSRSWFTSSKSFSVKSCFAGRRRNSGWQSRPGSGEC